MTRRPGDANIQRLIDWLDQQDKGGRNKCWLYPASLDTGYGLFQFRVSGKKYKGVLVHRFSYERFVGPIGTDAKGRTLTIDHLCRNRACANPEHLEAVPVGVNILRGISPAARNKRKTRCLRGHPFDGDNLQIDRLGKRVCRECRRIRDREAKKRHPDRGMEYYWRVEKPRNQARRRAKEAQQPLVAEKQSA